MNFLPVSPKMRHDCLWDFNDELSYYPAHSLVIRPDSLAVIKLDERTSRCAKLISRKHILCRGIIVAFLWAIKLPYFLSYSASKGYLSQYCSCISLPDISEYFRIESENRFMRTECQRNVYYSLFAKNIWIFPT